MQVYFSGVPRSYRRAKTRTWKQHHRIVVGSPRCSSVSTNAHLWIPKPLFHLHGQRILRPTPPGERLCIRPGQGQNRNGFRPAGMARLGGHHLFRRDTVAAHWRHPHQLHRNAPHHRLCQCARNHSRFQLRPRTDEHPLFCCLHLDASGHGDCRMKIHPSPYFILPPGRRI